MCTVTSQIGSGQAGWAEWRDRGGSQKEREDGLAGEEMGQGATGTGAGSETRLEDPPDWRLQTINITKFD